MKHDPTSPHCKCARCRHRKHNSKLKQEKPIIASVHDPIEFDERPPKQKAKPKAPKVSPQRKHNSKLKQEKPIIASVHDPIEFDERPPKQRAKRKAPKVSPQPSRHTSFEVQQPLATSTPIKTVVDSKAGPNRNVHPSDVDQLIQSSVLSQPATPHSIENNNNKRHAITNNVQTTNLNPPKRIRLEQSAKKKHNKLSLDCECDNCVANRAKRKAAKVSPQPSPHTPLQIQEPLATSTPTKAVVDSKAGPNRNVYPDDDQLIQSSVLSQPATPQSIENDGDSTRSKRKAPQTSISNVTVQQERQALAISRILEEKLQVNNGIDSNREFINTRKDRRTADASNAKSANNSSKNFKSRTFFNSKLRHRQPSPKQSPNNVQEMDLTSDPNVNDSTRTRQSTTGPTILSYHNISVKQYDLDTLQENEEISDTIIGFWMEWLQHEQFNDKYDMLFLEPSIVQHLKLSADIDNTLQQLDVDNRNFIFMPLSDSQRQEDRGSHWYLVVLSRPEQRCYIYDSNYNTEMLGLWYNTCQHLMHVFGMHSMQFENVACLRQSNQYDCGLHVMSNSGIVARHIVANNACRFSNVTDPSSLLSRTDIIARIMTTAAALRIANNVNSDQLTTGNDANAARMNANTSKTSAQKRKRSSNDNANPDQTTNGNDANPARNNANTSKSSGQKRKRSSNNNDEPQVTDDTETKKKRKRSGKYTKKADKTHETFTTVKCTLNAIVQSTPNAQALVHAINELVLRTTRMCYVASLMVLYTINRHFNAACRNQCWNFFLEANPTQFITECFQAVTKSSRRTSGHHPLMTPEFRMALNANGVLLEDTARMNNAFKHAVQLYTTNFKNNLVVHAKKRLQFLINLRIVQMNGRLPDKTGKRTIRNTLNYMFNPNSKCAMDQGLAVYILSYIPNLDDIDIGSTDRRGFMSWSIKTNWFKFIPTFMRLQRQIAEYQRQCRINGTKISVRNFKVVPLHDLRRKHVKIDGLTLKRLMEFLKIHPRKISEKTGRTNILTDSEFIGARVKDPGDPTKEYNPHWFTFLRWNKIKRMQRGGKQFHYELLTDGVSVSVSFTKKTNEPAPESFEDMVQQQMKKYATFGRNYAENLYDGIIGIDPGYKLYIAAVIRNQRTDEEKHVKLSSKQFYSNIRQNYRDKKAHKWTHDHEESARIDRQNTNVYADYPSSMTANYMQYIRHALKFFHSGLTVYTTRKYARLQLDQHIRTQKAMDDIVNTLTQNVLHNGRLLVCIEGKPFNPSSPIKKYRRCPGTRKLIECLNKVTVCDVIYVDEYNTSKACARCYRLFDRMKHKQWERKKIRHRLCDDCTPNDRIISLPSTIVAPKPQRQLQNEQRQMQHFIYQNHMDVSWDESKVLARSFFQNLTPNQRHNHFQKNPFDPAIHKPVQKTVWNRDVSAARNMITKAICMITNTQNPQSLTRRTAVALNEDEDSDSSNDDDDDAGN